MPKKLKFETTIFSTPHSKAKQLKKNTAIQKGSQLNKKNMSCSMELVNWMETCYTEEQQEIKTYMHWSTAVIRKLKAQNKKLKQENKQLDYAYNNTVNALNARIESLIEENKKLEQGA